MAQLIPCIISGGAGTRLWPVSREARPKPFMRLPDGESLLQKTFKRAAKLPGVERIITVTGREHFFGSQDHYRSVNTSHIPVHYVLEPCGRNTAPAIAVAALQARKLLSADCQLLILPADHLISDETAFARAVEQAQQLAAQGHLVTFGIKPTRAETGYGYIESGESLGEGCYSVARFIEKPSLDKAQEYWTGGRHLWNAGMFCLPVDLLLNEFNEHAQEVLNTAQISLDNAHFLENKECTQCELRQEDFIKAPDISIDYALMERSHKVAVVPCELGWNDIGSWQTLRELSPSDERGNQLRGEILLHEVDNCYIDSPHRLIGAVGVRDLIVVDTADALLIADAKSSQDVKFIAQTLKKQNHQAYKLHRTVHRPWGVYSVIEEGSRYKIKRIVVRPGAALSLQMHHHRSEHWIVVSGIAKVTNGEREFLLDTNQSTFIAAGHQHRLSNPGVIDLVMIEVQSGEYLGEDDIVRFDDVYGRTQEPSA